MKNYRYREHVCKQCGKDFKSSRTDAEYCKPGCRSTACRERAAKRRVEEQKAEADRQWRAAIEGQSKARAQAKAINPELTIVERVDPVAKCDCGGKIWVIQLENRFLRAPIVTAKCYDCAAQRPEPIDPGPCPQCGRTWYYLKTTGHLKCRNCGDTRTWGRYKTEQPTNHYLK